MMLELGSIDMMVVQRHTGNTPLLLLAKVIDRDSAEACEVAGAASPCSIYIATSVDLCNRNDVVQAPCSVKART